METISRLRSVLLNALGSRGLQHGEQELFDELMVHKTRLLHVFDVGPRNTQEQREIESGKTVVNGRSIRVNADFARLTIFLSQQLDCSEQYVAGIMYTIMAENPNISPVSCLENAIAEFHERRRHLADSLRFLFEAAQASRSTDSEMYQRLDTFVRTELVQPQHVQGGEISMAYRIFKEIEDLGEVIARAYTARQNAGSNTVAPGGQANPTLGYDVLNSRYESLKNERRSLANVLYLIGRMGYFFPNEIKVVVDWLSNNPNHAMTYYVLTAVLATFDPVDPRHPGEESRRNLATDAGTMTFMTNKLAPSTEWKEPGLKATILLKWTLFLTEARHNDPELEHRDGFRTDELETQVWTAVQGDAFTYLALAVFQLEKRRGNSAAASFINVLSLSPEQEQLRDLPPDDFRPVVLSAFETLVRSLITHASSELRKIKQRQEDLVLATARSDRSRASNARFASSMGPETDKVTGPSPRSDISMLYSFIGLLYSALPPESALQFWGSGPQGDSYRVTYAEYIETTAGKLPAFLQWAVWSTQVHDIEMSRALYDMLAGLSTGQQCSELAYNFMVRGGGEVISGSMVPSSSSAGPAVSWGVIFGLLESWASASSNPRNPSQTPGLGANGAFDFTTSQNWKNQYSAEAQSPPQPVIGPKEVLLAQSFLRLLSTVVKYSVAVRKAISRHVHFRAIPTLVSLVPLAIPLELKGAIFNTLSAFCEPGAGKDGVEICKAVWTLMERLEVINVRVPIGGFGVGLPPVKGIEMELDEVEAAYRMYPSTIPFLKLLSTLIHTPKRVPLKDRIADAEPINTTPETLGQPYRLPGVGPFVSFVIDTVFSKIGNRDYLVQSDRWKMNDLCLCFIERVVASFDLESLVSLMEDSQMTAETIVPFLVHPGYDVMKRLLTNSSLQSKILSYIVEGVGGFDKEIAETEVYFRSTIIRVLRIVHRVLEIQDIFIDVLIPLLSEFDSAPFVGTVHSRSYFTRFDQALSFGPQYVPALATYVVYPAHPELVLLSVKILSALCTSNAFSNLTALVERSNDSERILSGFRQILQTESMENILVAEATADRITGAGAPEEGETPEPLEQAIRLAVLDLLIQNTEVGRPSPNIAHFLLFGGTSNGQQIQDPHALGARQTCIHVILNLVNAGVPRLKGKGRDRHQASQTKPLFATLPGLAERCYRIIYQLCVHPRTSEFTMRYLRTREDFFVRQLVAIPAQVPETLEESPVQVVYNDGSRITTTVPAISSFLRLRSWIFDLVALDLHVLTNKGHFKSVMEILDILFGNGNNYYNEPAGWEDDVLQPFREVGQSHLRIIEFLESLHFDWSDSLVVNPLQLQFFSQLNLQSCIRTDATGCEIVDRTALLSLLTAASHTLNAQGSIVTPAHSEQLTKETTYILESCAVENHRREISHATATGYESWRRLLDMTLTKCFTRLPHDRRENMLFDLLHALPNIIRSSQIQESTAILLSETVLSAITKLREDRRYQTIIQSAGGDAEAGQLPAERLYSILRSIMECTIDNNHAELVRGNLYAALINYVHLITSAEGGLEDSLTYSDSRSLSLSASTLIEDFAFDDDQSNSSLSQTGRLRSSASPLEIGSLNLLKKVVERLVATISRDAIDGTEVWKTIAFMLLDSLVQLSRLEKQHVVLSVLVRHGILSNFVRGVKESDLRLQAILKPDPDDLNPLYVYEGKMSLFIRMAQTRAGAERLMDAQLLTILSECDYLDARPEADQTFIEHDSFLPSAIQRFHQLFMPALQVVDGMLATLGPKHSTVAHQALGFLSSHRDTIMILLKNESDRVPLALVEEMHLLISLCTAVLPMVPKMEMLTANSEFGGIHAAVLNLATRCLGDERLLQSVKPFTEVELIAANSYAYASGYGSETETKFDHSVRQKERALRKAIIMYIGAASEFTEPEITVVLSPTTALPKKDKLERVRGQSGTDTTFISTIPTIGDTIEALNLLCADLAGTLKQIKDLAAELAAKDHMGVDSLQDIIKGPDLHFLQDLDMGQKRTLVCQELERVERDAKYDAKSLLGTMEMLLLLLWRHLEYYSYPDAHAHNPPNPTSHAMRFVAATPDPEIFREEVGRRLGPTLQRLATLELDSGALGDDWQASERYLEIMCQRLEDSAGLNDGEPSQEDS